MQSPTPTKVCCQENHFPFYALFIEIDPKHVDVNVHPTKTEIKFDDERSVYGVVWSAVKQALGSHNLAPAIDFTADVNLMSKVSSQPLSREQYYDEQFSSLQRSNLQNWNKLFEQESGTSKLFEKTEVAQKTTVRFESAINKPEEQIISESEKGIFQFQQKYIVARGAKWCDVHRSASGS